MTNTQTAIAPDHVFWASELWTCRICRLPEDRCAGSSWPRSESE